MDCAGLVYVSSHASFFLIVVQLGRAHLTHVLEYLQLMGVEAFLAHHHAGDVGPPPAWGGIADDGPDAVSSVPLIF